METTKSLGRSVGINWTEEEEVQGLQGPIAISELILQKIWLGKDFLMDNLVSHSQKKIQIISPGRWNQFEGPDFREAEVIIDGERIIGDIEIHFHPDDWFRHGHNDNRNFSGVVLHVTLFEPRVGHPPIFTSFGYCPETLVLLPYLKQGLEEYVVEDALFDFENRDNNEFIQSFLDKPEFDIKKILVQKAQLRWQQKCNFARSRIEQNGVEETCHQMALEVLGYRRNRAPMSLIAMMYDLQSLVGNRVSAGELFDSQRDKWKLAKIRPANHPKKRLEQYLSLVQKRPSWPMIWLEVMGKFSVPRNEARDSETFRKEVCLSELQNAIRSGVLGETICGTRFHTLIIDALLPIANEYFDRDLFDLWFHWHAGDIPAKVSSFLDTTNIVNRSQPFCNGLSQGILQLLIESHFI